MGVIVFGVNHTSTALEQLEQISLSSDELTQSLLALHQKPDIEEIIILSTCNRTEFYIVSQNAPVVKQHVVDRMIALKGCGQDKLCEQFYLKEHIEAKQHLFRVACGLDSLVIGENEIIGQIKTAYKTACQFNTAGTLFHRLFHAAFKTSKRVKNETAINQGSCSVGATAVDMVTHFQSTLNTTTVLLIGAGEIGHITARILARRSVGTLLIANRSPDKAVRLANEVGGTAVPFPNISELIGQVDVIISSTSSPDYLFTLSDVQTLLSRRTSEQLLIIDIALPRDFDPAIATLPGVVIKNIYDLKAIVDLNRQKREQEILPVERIIEEELQKFLNWQASREIHSVIHALKTHIEDIRREELQIYHHRVQEDTFRQMEKLTRRLTGRYVHSLIAQLKFLHETHRLSAENLDIIEALFDDRIRQHSR